VTQQWMELSARGICLASALINIHSPLGCWQHRQDSHQDSKAFFAATYGHVGSCTVSCPLLASAEQ
jgi:hypothetical protein